MKPRQPKMLPKTGGVIMEFLCGVAKPNIRAREKLHELEKNISVILRSSIDDASKRLILSTLSDYKSQLLNMLNNENKMH